MSGGRQWLGWVHELKYSRARVSAILLLFLLGLWPHGCKMATQTQANSKGKGFHYHSLCLHSENETIPQGYWQGFIYM